MKTIPIDQLIRETAEKLRTENPDAYKVLCDFYAEARTEVEDLEGLK